ncbi:hypothetical protein IVY21_00335 [Salmonella enterica subsp. enterica serovar Worthington]|nr:hypothetical protein [Salmonella enterica subsp. enterica serovar Worthington]
MPFCTLPERGKGVMFTGDRILPEAVVIHNRFNTPFTSNLIAEGYYFSPVALSHIFTVAPFKSVNYRRENKSRWFSRQTPSFFFNNLFIFKLATQVTFNAVAQSCNIVDIFR